jgi:hypothetical protein
MEQAYYIADGDPEYFSEYSILKGPDGWECVLTEPEDRSWYRDGNKAIQELNRLYNELEEAKKTIKSYEEKYGL